MIIFVINVHSMYVTTYKWKYSKCLELYVNFTVYLRQVCTPRSSALPGHQTSDKRPLFNLINIQYIGITFAIHKQLHLNATFSLWSPISGSHRTILPVRGDWQFSINPCIVCHRRLRSIQCTAREDYEADDTSISAEYITHLFDIFMVRLFYIQPWLYNVADACTIYKHAGPGCHIWIFIWK